MNQTKRIIGLLVWAIFFSVNHVNAQAFELSNFASKQTEKWAKEATAIKLDSLAKELDIPKRKARPAKFELTPCALFPEVDKGEGMHSTPAGDFPVIQSCRGSFFYVFRSNDRGGHYLINFFYDNEGRIIGTELSYMWVTR